MMKKGDQPYWLEPFYQQALDSEANTIILMFGTNDAKTFNWSYEEYRRDYIDMVNSFKSMESQPKIYLMIPPPLYKEVFDMIPQIINLELRTLIPDIAQDAGIPKERVINLFEALGGIALDKEHMFVDGCHPNDEGYAVIADTVMSSLGLQ